MHLLEILQPQPLRREARRERVGARIGQHPLHLRLKHRRRVQRLGARRGQQTIVGNRAPQEEREPRGEFEIVYLIVGASRRGRGLLLEAEHEVRTGQHRLQAEPHAFFERVVTAVFRALIIELHQARLVIRGERTTIGPRAKAREDLLGTGALQRGGRGRTAEDALAAGRVGHARDAIRTGYEYFHERRRLGGAGGAGSTRGARPLVRLDQIFVRPFGRLREGDGHLALSRLHLDRLAADEVGAQRRVGGFTVARDAAIVAQQGHALAVDGDVEIFHRATDATADVQPEFVFTVGGERVQQHQTAARAVRCAVYMIPRMLRREGRRLVRGLPHRRLAIADRHAAHGGRGVQVALQQGGRQRLHIGDVVEVRALGVERQPVTGRDFEAEQVADHALVLGSVQPLEGARARIHRGRAIDHALEGFDQRRQCIAGRALGSRRRHHLRAQLADDLFGCRQFASCIHDRIFLEVEIAATLRRVVTPGAVLLHDVVKRTDRHAAYERRLSCVGDARAVGGPHRTEHRMRRWQHA